MMLIATIQSSNLGWNKNIVKEKYNIFGFEELYACMNAFVREIVYSRAKGMYKKYMQEQRRRVY